MTTTFASVNELLAYDGTADVIEVKRPANGILRSASSAPMTLKHTRKKKTIFVPENGTPFELRFDTNVIKAAGRAMASLVSFNIWGGPHFEGITDLDLVACQFNFPYADMHRDPKMKAMYSDRAKILFLQNCQRVGIYAAHVIGGQGGIPVSGSTDLTLAGARFEPTFGGPTTNAVHPDFVGCVGGGTTNLHVVDSTVLSYPRVVFQGETPHRAFVFSNLWLAANVLPLQFMPTVPAPKGDIDGKLKNLRIWFTGGTNAYRVDAGHFATQPGKYWKNDPRITVPETDVQIVNGKPTGPFPESTWWDQAPLELARHLAA